MSHNKVELNLQGQGGFIESQGGKGDSEGWWYGGYARGNALEEEAFKIPMEDVAIKVIIQRLLPSKRMWKKSYDRSTLVCHYYGKTWHMLREFSQRYRHGRGKIQSGELSVWVSTSGEGRDDREEQELFLM